MPRQRILPVPPASRGVLTDSHASATGPIAPRDHHALDGHRVLHPRRELHRHHCERPERRQARGKRTVLVQVYSFTSAPIAKALLDAFKRGVRVDVILDSSNRTDKYSSADFLANQGVSTKIDAAHSIAHNKVHDY
jgi:phosphatidylserine/phosphatidylglycerophosphate/cardiolipin synthase-like enzyme